jgi:hypothetical protein
MQLCTVLLYYIFDASLVVWETIYLLQTTCVGSLVELVNLHLFETILFVWSQIWVLLIMWLLFVIWVLLLANLGTISCKSVCNL